MIDETQEAEAEIVSRERAVVCGLGVVEAVFTRFDWRTPRAAPGGRRRSGASPGTTVATIHGPAAAVLAGERTALNFLQHLSGIATVTQAAVAATEGPSCASPTPARRRPGLRALEKYAVRAGGGSNFTGLTWRRAS